MCDLAVGGCIYSLGHLPVRVIPATMERLTLGGMANPSLSSLSSEIADLASAASPAIVQVIGARRPASGVVHDANTIVTTARAIGREDGLRIRVGDREAAEADLVGWDPATGIAVLRTREPLSVPAPPIAEAEPRPGQIVVALARSWSHALTVSGGLVAVVGGPLRTGRRRAIPRVIRVTAPMHDGFAGGAVFDVSGQLTGVATGSAIRGFGVAIPASIAWAAAAQIIAGGTPRRGFVGLAVQPVELAPSQRTDERARALLVVAVTPRSPADAAGFIVGDILLGFDGGKTESPDDLLDLLIGDRIGKTVTARTLRGGAAREMLVTVAERPTE
jgi:S1-C subfamily serine protease